MNVETGTVAAQFLFWENLFKIYGIDSLQCVKIKLVRCGTSILMIFEKNERDLKDCKIVEKSLTHNSEFFNFFRIGSKF
jgi:hypothetical protein